MNTVLMSSGFSSGWSFNARSFASFPATSIGGEIGTILLRRDGNLSEISLTTTGLARATDFCGVRSGRDIDKFTEMKLTKLESAKIRAPGVAESPVVLECRVKQIVRLGSHDMFLAEIVAVHASETLFDPKTGAMHLERANLVAYSNGHYYDLGKILGKFGYSVQRKK